MAAPAFGEKVPCRLCDGRGEVRHRASDEEKRARSREAARARRLGVDLAPVPSMDKCPECRGEGYVTPERADHPYFGQLGKHSQTGEDMLF